MSYTSDERFNKWKLAFGLTNGLRTSIAAGTDSTITRQTRIDADFIWTKAIGDLEVAVGGDRNKVLVNIEINDKQEQVFDQYLPWDTVFGSAQRPHILQKARPIPAFTRYSVIVKNQTGVAVDYNWLLQGYNIYKDMPMDVDLLIEDVFKKQSRVSSLSWSQSNDGTIIFPGGVVPMPAAPVGGFVTVTSISNQNEYPFLLCYILSAGPAIAENVYAQFTDISIRRDVFFDQPVLFRMIQGTPNDPFLLDAKRPYNRVELIQMDLTSYAAVPVNIPISFMGVKAPERAEYNLAKYTGALVSNTKRVA